MSNEGVTIRREYLDFGLIGFTLFATLVLVSPLTDLRSIVTPLFIFLLPGCATTVLVRRELKSPAEFIALSFLMSISFIFVLRVILSRFSLSLPPSILIFAIAAWSLAILATSCVLDATRLPRISITLERSDVGLVVLLAAVYLGLSIFVLRASYTPTPDELTYMLNAHQFNLAGVIPVSDPTKAWIVNFVLARPVWFVSIASYLLVSAAPEFSSQVLSVFFFTMLVLATYRVGKRVLGGQVGLIAAILLALSPSLLIWGSTVLLDLPLAVFLIFGYGYFLEGIQVRNGKLDRVAFGALVLAVLSFAMSALLKLADPVLLALVYLYFVYLIWRSELPRKRIVLSIVVALPAIYLTFDAMYNIFTYVIPDTAIHDLIRPFLPLSFFERFFAFYYQGTAYKSGAGITPSGILQGIYLAGLAPFLLTYPVLFMSIAGVIRMIRSKVDLQRGHGVFSLLVVGLASVLAALFLYSYETARNVIYIYPFIIVAAAVGLRFSLDKGVKEFILSATGMVILIYAAESSMVAVGISEGSVPAPSQFTLSLFSINFAVGIAILVWKVLDSVFMSRTSNTTKRWKSSSWVSGRWIAAIAVVCLVCFSQFVVFTQTSPYRSTSNFSGLTPWLDSHVRAGELIFTNGEEALMSFANDTTLRAINDGSVRMLPVPLTATSLVQLAGNSSEAYLIVFKQAEYTDSDSYTPGQYFMQSKQWSTTLANGTSYQVYAVSIKVATMLSTIDVSTQNSAGTQIPGYYVTLLQNGSAVESCYSPCSFTVLEGEAYQVAVSSYGGERFSHWENDGATGFEMVYVPNKSGTISLTAIFDP